MPSSQTITAELLLERLDAIGHELARRDDALALLALGSVGSETERLDAWSDLDFFVLVRDGAKKRYLDDLDWLSAAHPLAWHFQNTVDGHKALMTDGIFCEFAIFELAELSRIPYAPGRFVWRRDEVDASLAHPAHPMPTPADDSWLVGEALSNLLVGLQRHARGEKLAALRMIQVQALDLVLELLEKRQSTSPEAKAQRDPFNVTRRLEARHPSLVEALSTFAAGYESTGPAALALLAELESAAPIPTSIAERIRALAKD